MTTRGFIPHIVAIAISLLAARPAFAQGRLQPFSAGDGRIHSAPTLEVVEMDLHPGQVTTINLHPRYHTVLEFPYVVARVDGGDQDVFMVDPIGNKLTLKAIDIDVAETSMTVILGDPQQTLIPFLVRVDTTQPMAYVVKFTDPITKHLNEAERQISERLSSNIDARVATLAEAHVRQRLLFRAGTVNINKSKFVGPSGERVGFVVEDAELMPGPSGEPQVYIRYRIVNLTPIPLDDANIVAKIGTKRRRKFFFSQVDYLELSIAEDVRTTSTIPAGAAARGLLILEGLTLQPNQELTLELHAFRNRRTVKIDRVLVGSDR